MMTSNEQTITTLSMTFNINKSIIFALFFSTVSFCGDGDEDFRSLTADIFSIGANINQNNAPMGINLDISRYGTSTLDHFYGAGVGVDISNKQPLPHILAKYAFKAMIGAEAGPMLWFNDYGALARLWIGLGVIGFQTSFTYTHKRNMQSYVGFYIAVPFGESASRSGYNWFPLW